MKGYIQSLWLSMHIGYYDTQLHWYATMMTTYRGYFLLKIVPSFLKVQGKSSRHAEEKRDEESWSVVVLQVGKLGRLGQNLVLLARTLQTNQERTFVWEIAK